MLRKYLATRRRLSLETLEARLCLSSLPVGTSTTVPDAATQAHLSAAYGQLPLSFEANQGQTDSRVNFLSRGAGYSLYLTPTKAVLSFKHGNTSNVVGMSVVGANLASHSVGLDRQSGVSNYFIGNDPSKWHTDVPNYAKVDYQGVYHGIDLVYHGNQKQLEYDFVVAPGADPRAIRLAFDGTRSGSLDRAGNLVLHIPGGDVIEHAPVVYQEVNGHRQMVAGRYVLHGNHQVGFQVGRYDHGKPLVIDPTLSYSTYLGGRADDGGRAIAVDSSGNAYITGFTASSNFPTKGPVQPSNAGGNDVFVTKLNPTGTALVYSTYLGGSNSDIGNAIAVDSSGNAYVTGSTTSANFPTTSPLQGHLNGSEDAFLLKLNPAGTALVYSTYLGGSGTDAAYGIAVGGSGNVYVTGTTTSADFPTTPGAYQTTNPGTVNSFVAQVNVTGSSLAYATYLGSDTFGVHVSGIAVDGSGNAYVTGNTGSTNFATAGAYQTVLGGQNDAFVAKLNAAGSALVYATYLGGSGDDRGLGIAVDGSGNAYVTGVTSSTNFPTLNAYQPVYGGNGDAFVTEFNASGSGLLYSTYLGGSASDGSSGNGGAIAVDATGNIYVTGSTFSTNFPTLNAFQSTNGGYDDAFVAKINPAQSGTASLVYSSYLGGSADGGDEGYGIAVDSSGNAYLTGETNSTNFPTTTNAFQTRFGGPKHTLDAFVTKITAS
jgi:hypothetical protein